MVKLPGTIAVLGGIFASNLLIGMYLAMASLAVVTALGFAYPIIRQRSIQDLVPSGKEALPSLGGDKMNKHIDVFKAERKFNEGIIFIYRALRELIPSMLETGSKDWTELELLTNVLRNSPELRNVSSHITRAYQHYEEARFGRYANLSSLESMVELSNEINRLNMILRARVRR